MTLFSNISNGQIIELNLSTHTNSIYIANVYIIHGTCVTLSILESKTQEIDKYYIRSRDKVVRRGKTSVPRYSRGTLSRQTLADVQCLAYRRDSEKRLLRLIGLSTGSRNRTSVSVNLGSARAERDFTRVAHARLQVHTHTPAHTRNTHATHR